MKLSSLPAFARGQGKIEEIRPLALPAGVDPTSIKLGQIGLGNTVGLQPILIGNFVIGTKPEHGLTLKDVVTGGACVTAAGTNAWQADKIAAMPVADLAHLLQQTPVFALNAQPAQTLAVSLKEAANSALGHYIVVGTSGGLVAVGIASWFRPKASFKEVASWFVGGALLVVAVVWGLVELGILGSTASPKQ